MTEKQTAYSSLEQELLQQNNNFSRLNNWNRNLTRQERRQRRIFTVGGNQIEKSAQRTGFITDKLPSLVYRRSRYQDDARQLTRMI